MRKGVFDVGRSRGGEMKLKELLEDHPLAVPFISFASSCIIAFFILICAGYIKIDIPEPGIQPNTGPSIYITRTDRVLTLGGETVWILEYTVDGRFEAPAFHSPEAMAEYREYLDTIGKVYRREEEEQ
jgi:hypothetical protein